VSNIRRTVEMSIDDSTMEELEKARIRAGVPATAQVHLTYSGNGFEGIALSSKKPANVVFSWSETLSDLETIFD